eukprot:1140734-Pelagomonas_calceolata.AAC.5
MMSTNAKCMNTGAAMCDVEHLPLPNKWEQAHMQKLDAHASFASSIPLRLPRKMAREAEMQALTCAGECVYARLLRDAFEARMKILLLKHTHTHTQVGEVLRGVRAHYTRFIDGLAEKDFRAAQLGLAHAYSRSKVRRHACVASESAMSSCKSSRLFT